MQRYGYAALRSSDHRKPRSLCSAKHGIAVLLSKNTLNRHDIRNKRAEFLRQAVEYRQQPDILRILRGAAYHVHMDKRKPARTAGFYYADSASRKTGIGSADDHCLFCILKLLQHLV